MKNAWVRLKMRTSQSKIARGMDNLGDAGVDVR